MKLQKTGLKKVTKNNFLKTRIFAVLLGVGGMFCLLFMQFYKLQIIEHEEHEEEVIYNTQRRVETQGVRGLIFDRYGKPLAINKPIYTIKVDQQAKLSKKELNAVLLKVINVLEENSDHYTDDIPLSKTSPFIFTQSESARKKFVVSIPYNDKEHREEIMAYSPQELFDYLRSDKVFQIDESYTDEEARKIMAVRHQMYQVAYQKYKPITIAQDISEETLSVLSEHHEDFPAIFTEIESYRYYPYGKEFGNVLGYTRAITTSQYEEMKALGYDKNDIIGQMGVEQTMEPQLRGQTGIELIEVDNVGRKVHTLESKEPIQGNDVFLTIDADLQIQAYEAIEKRLTEALVQRMQGGMRGVQPLKPREILVSMVESNQLSIEMMKDAEEGSMQKQLYDKLAEWFEQAVAKPEYKEKIEDLTLKEFMVLILKEEQIHITDRELLLALSEQGSLKLDESLVKRIWSGNYPALKDILIAELESGDLKPEQMAIDPFSATAVVIDVNTGDVLTVVGYPSYDSNEMTTNFNQYYSILQDGIDQRNLLWNRALLTTKAPGSTYKMITAIAGLETGVIDVGTTISDSGPYTKAGAPYPKCWFFTNNGYGHGPANVHRALEVSCNYYFYDVAYRLGQKFGVPYGAIDIFTQYATMFGLDHKTGVELAETAPNVSNPYNLLNTNIAKALNVIRNATEKGQEVFDNMAVSLLNKGIYPYAYSKATDFEGKLEYQLQTRLKKDIDDMFKDAGDAIILINQSLIGDFKVTFSQGVTQISSTLANDILLDASNRSLTAKTKDAVRVYLGDLVSQKTYGLIEAEIDVVDSQEMYIDALEKLLSSKQISEFSVEEQELIKERLEAVEEGNFNPVHVIAKRVAENIIDELVDYLFENAELEWTNAINIRTAIGQGNNAFTPLQIGRYIAGLANGEMVYDLKVVGGIKDNKENTGYNDAEDKVFGSVDLKPTTIDAVQEGMYRVINGKEGTARSSFTDAKVKVAGKTGTAQEAKTEHSWFAGFAPYDDPEVVVVTTMYGADGLGKFNYLLAKDIFNIMFDEEAGKGQATMNNTFEY